MFFIPSYGQLHQKLWKDTCAELGCPEETSRDFASAPADPKGAWMGIESRYAASSLVDTFWIVKDMVSEV